jgi:DUF4097 and DUF4098 domain-containing protein YvlB
MAKEENLLILKMLQEGTITAEQAAELLAAVDSSESRAAAAAPVPPTPPVPPVPPVPPTPPTPPSVPLPPQLVGGDLDFSSSVPDDEDAYPESETFKRARERIAAAREKVAGVQEQLSAAEEKLENADPGSNPWEAVADALKDVPGARSVADALRGIDPRRIAAGARRQARRVARQVRHSLGDLSINIDISESFQGEPQLSAPREATASIPPGGVLRVKNPLGDIEAIGSDVPEARAAGVLRVWAADQAAAEAIAEQVRLVVEHGTDGPTLTVQAPPRSKRIALDLKVFVPTTIEGGVRVSLMSPAGDVKASRIRGSVVLATQSGDAKASEIAGDVAAETASGDIAVEGVLGNVTASSASGDIAAVRLSGQSFKATTQSGDVELSEATTPVVSVETVSGDAEVRGIAGRTLRVRAVSGDVEAEDVAFDEQIDIDTVSGSLRLRPQGPLTAGTVRLATISGDAEVELPARTDAALDVSTKSGDVRVAYRTADGGEQEVSKSGMATLSETIGKGAGAKLTLTSVSGDIKVEQETGE